MSWQSLSLTLVNKNDADILEDFLLELGAVSITYTDAGDEPILEPDLNTTPLWTQTNLTALFDENSDLDSVKVALIARFGKEKFIFNHTKQLKEKAWEREWLKHFEPMKFGSRLWVCPSDLDIPEEEQSSEDIVVTLDPGLAFGTGTHETTALCLQELDKHDLTDCQILDFGCGSGILAIAALKLGASHAIAVDIDPQAITATNDNAERNDIHSELDIYLTPDEDNKWYSEESYDWVLANILSKPLLDHAEHISNLVREGGHILLSGILADQADDIFTSYSKYFDFASNSLQQKGDWVSIFGTRKLIENDALSADNHEDEFNQLLTSNVSVDELTDTESETNLPPNHNPTHSEKNISNEAIFSIDGVNIDNESLNIQSEQKWETTDASIEVPNNNTDDIQELDFDDIKNLGQKEKSKHGGFWLLTTLLGLFLLGGQFIHKNRAELALNSKLGPTIKKAYTYFPSNLEPNWQLDKYEVLSNSVTVHPEQSEQLLLNITFLNTALHAQMYPTVRLVLRNRWGKNIAYRDFSPKDYLTNNLSANSSSQALIKSNQRYKISIAVEDPGTEAKDFEIGLCLERTKVSNVSNGEQKILECQKDI